MSRTDKAAAIMTAFGPTGRTVHLFHLAVLLSLWKVSNVWRCVVVEQQRPPLALGKGLVKGPAFFVFQRVARCQLGEPTDFPMAPKKSHLWCWDRMFLSLFLTLQAIRALKQLYISLSLSLALSVSLSLSLSLSVSLSLSLSLFLSPGLGTGERLPCPRASAPPYVAEDKLES